MHVLSFARVFIYSLVYFIQILIFLLSEGSIMLYASLVFALVIKIYISLCSFLSGQVMDGFGRKAIGSSGIET